MKKVIFILVFSMLFSMCSTEIEENSATVEISTTTTIAATTTTTTIFYLVRKQQKKLVLIGTQEEELSEKALISIYLQYTNLTLIT